MTLINRNLLETRVPNVVENVLFILSLRFFHKNFSDFSDQHFKRLNQDIFDMEERYKGKPDSGMMSD